MGGCWDAGKKNSPMEMGERKLWLNTVREKLDYYHPRPLLN